MRDYFENVAKNVEEILSEDPEARDDDRILVFKYWDVFDGVRINVPRKILLGLTKPETIRRARQRIQAEGKFLGIRRGSGT